MVCVYFYFFGFVFCPLYVDLYDGFSKPSRRCFVLLSFFFCNFKVLLLSLRRRVEMMMPFKLFSLLESGEVDSGN